MIGDEISRWRSHNRIKQQTLASMLGVSHVAVSKWENNVSLPSKTMALRLADVMSNVNDSRLRTEIAIIAPQQQMKVLVRGHQIQLIAVSAGFRAAWPEMQVFIGQSMRPFLMNESLSYYDDSGLMAEAVNGDVLMVTCVSNRLLYVGGDVAENFRIRWYSIARRIGGELIHEVIFEPCAPGFTIGFEQVLRRSDIQSANE
jgi:transcriptional regulator with XRE-family HTH domain